MEIISDPNPTRYNKTAAQILRFLWATALCMILFSFCFQTPTEILEGLKKIVLHPDGLITDYSAVGGFGATFFNAGVIMAASILIVQMSHAMISGATIACILMMAGFSMFGKNIANIWPIVFGVYLFSKFNKESFSKYVYIALYGTALAPMITEVALAVHTLPAKIFASLLFGTIIGFLLPPLATYCLRVHQGYNLYNVGFAAGLIGALMVSVMKSLGFTVGSNLVWTYENNLLVVTAIYVYCLGLLLVGFIMIRDKKDLIRIYRHSGRLVADFILLDGVPATFFNMGSLGLFAVTYILVTGGTINGATLGGVFAVIGFGAFGKHLRNVIPIMAGVYIGSLFKVWSINDPAVQLAALFGTALAPISGQFGWPYGILVGVLHSSMVLNTGVLHGGLNLYNNGFSAGLIALIVVPLIENFQKRQEDFHKAHHIQPVEKK